WRLQARGQQHRRPKRAVKAGDVLADKMNVRRPPFLELSLIRAKPNPREVGQQSVEPNPDGEAFIERHPDAPGLARTRDVHVLQSALDQAEHLVATSFRLNEVGAFFVELDELLLELREREKVTRLAPANRRNFVVRAHAARLLDFRLCFERFAALAVPALIAA